MDSSLMNTMPMTVYYVTSNHTRNYAGDLVNSKHSFGPGRWNTLVGSVV